MALAYAFSFLIRMIWVYQFHDDPNFFWNGQLMINTNDGYFFASGAQKELFGLHEANPRVPSVWAYGVVFFTTLFAKITPFSLETIILYMPAVISSLVVVPIILIARLYKKTLWGFFAALLGSIAWSYYNRTMTGYYDSDMFSAMAPMFILYFLMKSTLDFNLRSALYAAIAIVLYPFLYDQGQAIVYVMGMLYGAYMVWYHRNENVTYASLCLIFLALIPFKVFGIDAPYHYVLQVIAVFAAYMVLRNNIYPQRQKMLMYTAAFLFIAFLLLGNVLGLIIGKVASYIVTGTAAEGLHYYSVNQTVREAGHIPFSVFANRISGSSFGVIIALLGYAVLVFRHRAFILALPLVGIGIFALFGGLRFTVYAVPVAALSAVYLFYVIGEQFKHKYAPLLLMAAGTVIMLFPNITHIIAYKVPTVLNKAEVEDLAKLDTLAQGKDYTLAWWDYGYPIWYYSDTSTLIDGGKHNNDNFIVSKILQTTSDELAANLSRLAVETYVKSGYKLVTRTLFDAKEKDPNLILSELETSSYPLPAKTRDVYLYLPYRMLNIFPTVALFGNLDLKSGKKLRNIIFYPARAVSKKKGQVQLSNGIVLDLEKGTIRLGGQAQPLQGLLVTQNDSKGHITVEGQRFHQEGSLSVIYMKSYGQFIVLDNETLNSLYVRMFILGKYDKNLFELVVASPYSRIYRLKK